MDIIKPTQLFIGNYRFDTYNNGVINAVNTNDKSDIHGITTKPEHILLEEVKSLRERLDKVESLAFRGEITAGKDMLHDVAWEAGAVRNRMIEIKETARGEVFPDVLEEKGESNG